MASLIVIIPCGIGLVAGAFVGTIAGTFAFDRFTWWLLRYGGGSFVIGSLLYSFYRKRHPHRDPIDSIFDIAIIGTGITFAIGYAGLYGKIKLTAYLYDRYIRGVIHEEIHHHLA